MRPLTHIPVLGSEVVASLKLLPGDEAIDATLGLGGHASLILKNIGPHGRLLGIERSAKGLVSARINLKEFDSQINLVQGDFRDLEAIARDHGYTEVAGVLFDLGLASWQIDTGEQGVSFQVDTLLDMRLTPFTPHDFTSSDSDPNKWTGNAALARTVRAWRFRSAHEFINSASAGEISNVLRSFGDIHIARRLTERIVSGRAQTPVERTSDLVALIGSSTPRLLALVFQALRILVNDEFGALVAGVRGGWRVVKSGGRLAVISFQSEEDRLVKRILRSLDGAGRILRLQPLPAEVNLNPRARSSTLRVIERK
ncbi:16S rRNA (cytosine(1402)-N(4))-methyltransferase [Candidatus Berkelbacteria bacterium]|nr:16S rRNA (cytosine(1402)-N(4))-methyltransferase [Candidatus Berkelbacteria bacterium]